MEEQVGELWHRLITRAAQRSYPRAAVQLDEVRHTVGVLFRALGGDGGLQVAAATESAHGARRALLQRIAGSGRQVALAWRDESLLRLPLCIEAFPQRSLNRDLYLWLAALAAQDMPEEGDWLVDNQARVCRALAHFPGLRARYRRLVEASIALRRPLGKLPADEAAAEQAIRAALHAPGSIHSLPAARRPPEPVQLWLRARRDDAEAAAPRRDDAGAGEAGNEGQSHDPQDGRRYQAERVDSPARDRGLLALRLESIFSWAEYIKVDRGTDESEDMEEAAREAQDMDRLSIARDQRRTASRIRFDLDLPAAASDDLPLGPGIPLPEWDYRRQALREDYCCLQTMYPADARPCELPEALKKTARQLRARFQALAPSRIWLRGQNDGAEIDLDACLDFAARRASGQPVAESGLYRDLRQGDRDLACLLLADLSLSTDSWVNDHARVIDVIRDSLFLFAEALSATGDRFAMAGFSSCKRHNVRYYDIKRFAEPYSATTRGFISAIKPGYYTRMGAAIRHASTQLAQQASTRRLLLLLTDGKPNDLDLYEGRYGIEDTRRALHEARLQGLQVFCVTVDRSAGDYLPHLFGSNAYVVIRRPEDLPQALPRLYTRLAQ